MKAKDESNSEFKVVSGFAGNWREAGKKVSGPVIDQRVTGFVPQREPLRKIYLHYPAIIQSRLRQSAKAKLGGLQVDLLNHVAKACESRAHFAVNGEAAL